MGERGEGKCFFNCFRPMMVGRLCKKENKERGMKKGLAILAIDYTRSDNSRLVS